MDRPPPPKTAEEYRQEEYKSARTGIAVLLLISYTIGRSVQLFSRKSGTSGGLPVLGSMIAIGAMGVYHDVKLQERGQPDEIDFGYFIIFSVTWLLVDVARSTFRKRGLVDDYCLGLGIFHRWLPTLSFESLGFVSDLLVAGGAALFFYAMKSPILGNWFAAMIVWISVCHIWHTQRLSNKRRRMQQAAARSAKWSS